MSSRQLECFNLLKVRTNIVKAAYNVNLLHMLNLLGGGVEDLFVFRRLVCGPLGGRDGNPVLLLPIGVGFRSLRPLLWLLKLDDWLCVNLSHDHHLFRS